MMNWPEVTIGIITYNRPSEIRKVVSALQDMMYYPDSKLRWVISDDCTPGQYLEDLENDNVLPDGGKYLSTPRNIGWGGNANFLRSNIRTPYMFLIEDDYVLDRTMDLTLAVAVMECRTDLGMIRYRGTGGTHVVFHQFEADISEYLPHFQQGYGIPGKISYLQLDSGSPSLYLYSNGPHLVHMGRFVPFYGPYLEGAKLGSTEEAYAHVVKDKMRLPNAPGIAILPEWIQMNFDHIGKSYQNTEFDQ